MAEYPQLSKAPIHEAIVDVRVSPSDRTRVEDLEALGRAWATEYPTLKSMRKFEGGFQVHPKVELKGMSQSPIGCRLENSDATRIVQIRVDGFTFSWLKPYDRWESLVATAKPLWEQFLVAAKPIAATRVATRFINRIELPIEGLDFDDYLTSVPVIPKTLPQTFGAFLSRVVVVLDAKETAAIITQAFEAPALDRGVLPVIVDIDVFREESFDPRDPNIWAAIDGFREWKNKAFFGAITKKTLEILL